MPASTSPSPPLRPAPWPGSSVRSTLPASPISTSSALRPSTLRGQSRQNRPAHRTRPDRPHFSRGRGQNAETPAQGHRLGGAQKRRLRGARAARHWPVHRNASAHHRHRRQQNHSRIPGHRICAFQARRPGGQTVHPTDQLDQVSKYIGAEAPKLNKLGGSDWAATKPRPASTSTRSPTT